LNPEDLGCQRWRPLKKAVGQRNRVVRESNETNGRLAALRERLPQSEQADREAYAVAVAKGEPEPERKTVELRAAIEAEQRRAEACAQAVENSEAAIGRLRNENNSAWRKQQFRAIAKAHAAYQETIRQLEQARETLADEVSLVAWIVDGLGVSEVRDSLSGRVTTDATGSPPLSFSLVLKRLCEDADDISLYSAESEARLPWQRVRAHVEALVGQGYSREEAMKQAGPSEWGGE
jgi:uncharacterized membrane protein YqiK